MNDRADNKLIVMKTICRAVLFAGIMIFVFDLPALSQKHASQHFDAMYGKRAEKFYHKIWNYYRIPEYGLFSEFYPQQHSDTLTYLQQGSSSKKVSYLWPLSGLIAATNRIMKLPGQKEKYKPFLDSVLSALEQYRDTTRSPVGYQAYPVRFEKVDRYYDDNGLVSIDYCDAYENTNNPVYLKRAKEAFTFILSGWSADLGGGVNWLEGHKDQKPACTNGMATLAALKLYEATKDRYYLNWGKKFYDWMKCLRDSTGIYANDIKTKDSSVNKTYYTYNSGSMLDASVMLYRFTKKKQYLDEARAIAEASFIHFGKIKENNRISILDLPWFVTVLFRGYEALYRIDGNPKYINTIKRNVDFAYDNSRDKYGLFYSNWNKEKDEYETAKWLLDEACIVELYARFAQLKFK